MIDKILSLREKYGCRGGRRSNEDAKKLAELAKTIVEELEKEKVYSFQLNSLKPKIIVNLNRIARSGKRPVINIRIHFE